MIRRRLVALALFACTIATAGFMAPTTTVATSQQEGYRYYTVTWYYSDSTHSVWVGERVIDCAGYYFYTGQVTGYFTMVTKEPCT